MSASREREVADRIDQMVASQIRAARQRQGGNAVAVEMPQAREEYLTDFADDSEELVAAKLETVSRLMDFVFQDGPHPGMVMRNFYAVVDGLCPERLYNMSSAEIAKMLDRTKAAHCWRLSHLFERMFKRAGVRGFKLRKQKSEEASAKYSEAQMGNTNRKSKPRKRRAA